MAVLSSSSWAVAVRRLEEEDSIVANELSGLRVAFLTANEGVEQAELTTPWQAVKDAGGTPELLAPKAGEVQAFNHLDKGSTFTVDRKLADATPGEYDGVVLPGGVANPDQLRTKGSAIRFLQDFFSEGKPVGVICHGPWTLVEADLVRDRRLTSWPSLQTDIRNAGGHWVDEEVVVDQGLVSSRNPDDLPAFCAKIVEEFGEGPHAVAEAGATAGTRAS
jgi:protease I